MHHRSITAASPVNRAHNASQLCAYPAPQIDHDAQGEKKFSAAAAGRRFCWPCLTAKRCGPPNGKDWRRRAEPPIMVSCAPLAAAKFPTRRNMPWYPAQTETTQSRPSPERIPVTGKTTGLFAFGKPPPEVARYAASVSRSSRSRTVRDIYVSSTASPRS